MKLGHSPEVFNTHFGDRRYFKMVEYGFKYADVFIDSEYGTATEKEYTDYWLNEKRMADEAGVTIFQVHGPFRYPHHEETPELRRERMELFKESLRITAAIGCKYWVTHPLMPYKETDFRPHEVWDINLEFFRELLLYAKERGITICLENMPMPAFPIGSPQQVLDFAREINDESFMVCLDTGHAWVCDVQPGDAARLFGDYLKVLHVHDNGGRTKGDQHLTPTMGTIDWDDFKKALVEIGYDGWGVFNLECNFSSILPNQSISNELRADIIRTIALSIAP